MDDRGARQDWLLWRPMRGQTLTDTQLLLELVGEAYSFEDLSQYRNGVLDLLARTVPWDSAGYNEIAPDELFALTKPQLPLGLEPRFAALSHENPLIVRYRRTGDGRPYRISDMVDQSTFRALALYREFYGRIGVEWQVAFTLPASAPLIIGVALCRELQDFSDREVQLLALARPHLIQAYRNAELRGARAAMLAALEEGLDTLGRHVVVLDPQGRLEFATDGARRLLGKHPTRPLSAVNEWIAARPEPHPAAEPLLLSGADGGLLVRVLPGRREDRRQVLLLEGDAGTLSSVALRGLGLTPREADTLRLVALGRSPAEAAGELGVARRTVDKHLQNVYAKLGTQSLGQAIAAAWAAVGVERSL